jgi:meso-butanediol dehydrogenase / (S,S)-butanediol dehydrogenase / diacetyl reductase
MAFATLPEKTGFVTGAGSGIGRATAVELAARGCAIAAFDIDAAAAHATAERIRASGGRAIALAGDVGSSGDVARAVEEAVGAFDGLDIVVANAGIAVLGTVLEIAESDWNRIISTNLTGVFLTAKHTVGHLIERGGGAIVIIASDAGITGAEGYTAYAATKHAVVGIARCLALDFGPKGVRTNAVCPAFVETAMMERIFATATADERALYRSSVPLGRFASPVDVARVVSHLASDDAAYTNGEVYSVDGGATAGYFWGDRGGAV